MKVNLQKQYRETNQETEEKVMEIENKTRMKSRWQLTGYTRKLIPKLTKSYSKQSLTSHH